MDVPPRLTRRWSEPRARCACHFSDNLPHFYLRATHALVFRSSLLLLLVAHGAHSTIPMKIPPITDYRLHPGAPFRDVARCRKADCAGPENLKPSLNSLAGKDRHSNYYGLLGRSGVGPTCSVYGASIAVETREFTDASTGSKQFGITIELKEPSRGSSAVRSPPTSFIDLDEIRFTSERYRLYRWGSTITRYSTKLSDFQVDYRNPRRATLGFRPKFSTSRGATLAVGPLRVDDTGRSHSLHGT